MTTSTRTTDRYRRFAEREARGESACYEEWALGVASDDAVLALLDALPENKRQPCTGPRPTKPGAVVSSLCSRG